MPGETRRPEIRVLAAGSLKDAFTAIFADFSLHYEAAFEPVWGPSGVLRERIQHGEPFGIFASAALAHAQTLTDTGLSGSTALLARNTLCVVTACDRALDVSNLADTMLDPGIRIGTSTPIADPGGDYTWDLFRRIDALRSGSFEILSTKAKQLFGGPTTATPVDGRHRLIAALEDGEIDLFIYYSSSATRFTAGSEALKSIGLPPEISVGPEYGITVSRNAPPAASAFAAYLLSPDGQNQLQAFGFIPANAPD